MENYNDEEKVKIIDEIRHSDLTKMTLVELFRFGLKNERRLADLRHTRDDTKRFDSLLTCELVGVLSDIDNEFIGRSEKLILQGL